MPAAVFETPNEKALSGAAALVVHSLFFAMLVVSVSWQKREQAALVAELWSSLPPAAAPRVEPPPPPPPKSEPKPPPPPPKVEAKPIPKAEPKPQPKADIELREKREREKKAKEQAALERKKREQQALAEKQRREERQWLEALKAQQAQEAEARRLAQEQAEAERRQAQERAAAQAREIDKYRRAIAARIRQFIVEPPTLQGNPQVEIDVTVLPGGEVLGARTRTPSGQPAWDNAVERAILRAQPLPLPPADSPIFREFRELNLKFRPKE